MEKGSSIWIIVTIILSIFLYQSRTNLKKIKEAIGSPKLKTEDVVTEIVYLQKQTASCRRDLSEIQGRLDEANDQISNARYYAGTSYEEMEEALSNLEEQ